MDELSPILEIFKLDGGAIAAISAWVFIFVAFLKSQFFRLQGIYTTIVSLIVSSGTVYGFMLKSDVMFDWFSFVLSSLICWVLAAGGNAVISKLSQGTTINSPAFKKE